MLTNLKQVSKFLRDEDGATAIEYALIASLIAIAIIVGATNLGTAISNKFKAVGDKLA